MNGLGFVQEILKLRYSIHLIILMNGQFGRELTNKRASRTTMLSMLSGLLFPVNTFLNTCGFYI